MLNDWLRGTVGQEKVKSHRKNELRPSIFVSDPYKQIFIVSGFSYIVFPNKKGFWKCVSISYFSKWMRNVYLWNVVILWSLQVCLKSFLWKSLWSYAWCLLLRIITNVLWCVVWKAYELLFLCCWLWWLYVVMWRNVVDILQDAGGNPRSIVRHWWMWISSLGNEMMIVVNLRSKRVWDVLLTLDAGECESQI